MIAILMKALEGNNSAVLKIPPPKPHHVVITLNLIKSIHWQVPVTTPLHVLWEEFWAIRKSVVKKTVELSNYALVLFEAPYMVLPLDATLQELNITKGVVRLESR